MFAGLRDYQLPHAAQLMHVLRTTGSALDASDTGTGKTFVALAIAKGMGVVPLVVAPKSVLPSWQRAAAGLGVDIEAINYERARGSRRGKKSAATGWGQEVVIGRGSRFVWKKPVELAIFDEVQRCGGKTTLNSKMLIGAKRQHRHVLMLSATAGSKPEQLKALGFTLGLFTLKDYRWWLLKHGCVPGIWGGIVFSDEPGEQLAAMEKISRAIFPAHGSRLRKDEIPGFPKTQVGVRLIGDVTGKAAGLADDLSQAYQHRMAQAEESEHHLTKLTRLRQALEILKVDDLVELALDYVETSRVAVFVNYTETVDAIVSALRRELGDRGVGVIDGRNDSDRQQVVDLFQSNLLPVVVINNAAGGVGLNLHDPTGRWERVSLISPCYSADVARQVLGRVHRDGAGFSQQYFVYFDDSLEAEIAQVLAQKFNNLDALNDADLNGVYS